MAWDDWVFGIPTAGGYNAAKWGIGKLTESPGEEAEVARKELLANQAAAAGGFADRGEQSYGQLGADARARMDYLRSIAAGNQSISGMQLRQGTQALQSQQRSMAAAAAPRDQAAAAHTAAMNSARLGYGMSGQAAMAGLQERRDAEQALAQLITQQRQQELNAALGSRQTAVSGLGAGNTGAPEKSFAEKFGPAITSGAAAFSDERLKTNVSKADSDSRARMDALQAYAYDYKNQEHGKGRQLGVMAQDLEKAGLGQAVFDTPEGKMINGAKLAGANTAMLASLGKRVASLEGRKRKRK